MSASLGLFEEAWKLGRRLPSSSLLSHIVSVRIHQMIRLCHRRGRSSGALAASGCRRVWPLRLGFGLGEHSRVVCPPVCSSACLLEAPSVRLSLPPDWTAFSGVRDGTSPPPCAGSLCVARRQRWDFLVGGRQSFRRSKSRERSGPRSVPGGQQSLLALPAPSTVGGSRLREPCRRRVLLVQSGGGSRHSYVVVEHILASGVGLSWPPPPSPPSGSRCHRLFRSE